MGFVKQIDESYRLMTEFLKNTKQTAGFGNIYVVRAVDKNGKTVDVKFGKNIFTDNGMSEYFINKKTFPNKFYIGSGTSDIGFDYTSTALIEPYDTTATLVSEVRDYAYPMYYDSISGVITTVCRALQVKFPLTISGIPDAIPITEYGIGSAMDNLWTHSYVYDTLGRYAEIIKYPEQELYIDVYFCMSYDESLILNNWNNHRYTMITTMNAFFSADHMGGTIYSFRRGNMKTSRTSTTTLSNFQNNVITKYINLNEFVMYRQLSEADGYIDGLILFDEGFITTERELLTSPEAFDEIVYPQGFKDTCISDKFGNYDAESIPLTQANITHADLYNPTTHEYDISETFSNDINKWYTETFLERTMAISLYYTNNNSIMQLYLYQNINTSDPILSFDNNMETVYACEKYWDKTTWHHINNLSQIPNADTNEFGHTLNCQTARYYTTSLSGTNVSLVPHRQSIGFYIIPSGGRSETYPFIKSGIICKDVNGSAQYQWYKYGNNVYFPRIPITYNLNDLNDTTVYTYVYGKWLIAFTSVNNNIIYYDMSNPSQAPTAQILNLPFNNQNVNMYNDVYRTENGLGKITVQGKTKNISYVIDFTGNTPVATEFATTKMCAIWGADRIAYILANDTTHINVYDFTSTSIIQTFDIPSQYTPSIIFGHTNYVWMVSTTATTDSYCYNISSGDSTAMVPLGALNNNNTTNLVCMTAINQCLVIYQRNQNDYAKNYWIRLSDPITTHTLEGLSTNKGYEAFVQYFLKEVNNGAILLLRVNARNNGNSQNALSVIADFGNFMDGNTQYVYTSPQSSSDDSLSAFIPYGEYIIINNNIKYPMEHWLPHKLVGTTNTISTLNHIVSIRNKQYYTTFTNVGDFRGLPPGVKQ